MRARVRVRERYAVVRLSHLQLLALHRAAGAAVEVAPDAFEDGHNRRAARQAHDRLGEAVDMLTRGERGPRPTPERRP